MWWTPAARASQHHDDSTTHNRPVGLTEQLFLKRYQQCHATGHTIQKKRLPVHPADRKEFGSMQEPPTGPMCDADAGRFAAGSPADVLVLSVEPSPRPAFLFLPRNRNIQLAGWYHQDGFTTALGPTAYKSPTRLGGPQQMQGAKFAVWMALRVVTRHADDSHFNFTSLQPVREYDSVHIRAAPAADAPNFMLQVFAKMEDIMREWRRELGIARLTVQTHWAFTVAMVFAVATDYCEDLKVRNVCDAAGSFHLGFRVTKVIDWLQFAHQHFNSLFDAAPTVEDLLPDTFIA